MQDEIPSAAIVRERLQRLSWSEVQLLCRRTGLPFTTVWKVRTGETSDPRLETVRVLWPSLIAAPSPAPAHG